MPSLLQFSLLSLLSLLLCAHNAHGAVTGRVLRCASIDQQKNYCLAYVRGGVKLLRQLSLADCRYQESWGYDAGGVWVDYGCRAEFFIRETQNLEELSEEADSGMTELMNMTIVAETLNPEKRPDWSFSLNDKITIGVDYNLPPMPVSENWPEDWQDYWFLPAILKINF